MKIGIISDTNGHLEPRVERIFKGVNHILHAGDIGYASIALELQMIAPVTAVLGNCDDLPGFPLTAVVTLGGKKFLVHHIVTPHDLQDGVAARIKKESPDVVVFGHTHKRYNETRDGILFLNPGYSGKPKLGSERSVAILHLEPAGLRTEFIPL